MSTIMQLNLTADLNRNLSIRAINRSITAIEKSRSLQALRLKVDVDRHILAGLNSLQLSITKIDKALRLQSHAADGVAKASKNALSFIQQKTKAIDEQTAALSRNANAQTISAKAAQPSNNEQKLTALSPDISNGANAAFTTQQINVIDTFGNALTNARAGLDEITASLKSLKNESGPSISSFLEIMYYFDYFSTKLKKSPTNIQAGTKKETPVSGHSGVQQTTPINNQVGIKLL